jgi:hypothetical protein
VHFDWFGESVGWVLQGLQVWSAWICIIIGIWYAAECVQSRREWLGTSPRMLDTTGRTSIGWGILSNPFQTSSELQSRQMWLRLAEIALVILTLLLYDVHLALYVTHRVTTFRYCVMAVLAHALLDT